MVPTIGIMIGAYIFMRLPAMATDSRVHFVVRVLAVIVIMLDLLCVFSLAISGVTPTPGLR